MLQQSFVIPIIKVTDKCNFTCEFCYYAQRNLHSRLMTVEECRKIIKETFDYNVRQNNTKMRVIFHGGEPLLQPLAFYKEIVQYEKELVKTQTDFQFFNSIQTNGYLINEDWASFFKEEDFDVGVSIDGDVNYNCHCGEMGIEESTHKVLENLRLLNSKDVEYGVISVITDKHTEDPEALYKFCKDNEIHNISLNYCYNEDSDDTVKNEKLVPFLKKLFDMYANGTYELNIREFNEMIAKGSGYRTDTCAMCDRENCGQYLSFDVNGNVFFCDTGYDKKSAIGNIKTESLEEIVDSYKYLEKLLQCRKVYQMFCKSCEDQAICGGGCHRYDKKNDGNYEHNYFCETQKELGRYVLEFIGSNMD